MYNVNLIDIEEEPFFMNKTQVKPFFILNKMYNENSLQCYFM